MLLSGCSTVSYTSSRSAPEVAECIASGWRTVPNSGYEVPVTLKKLRDYYMVDVVLVRDFPTFLPLRSIWAKVREAPTGSSTTYRRNLQISDKKIDRVVSDCQRAG